MRFIAGCDGAHNTVRRPARHRVHRARAAGRFAIADVHLDTSLPTDTMRVALINDGDAVALFPMRDQWRILLESHRPLPDPPDRDTFKRARRAAHVPARIADVYWSANYDVHQRRVAHMRLGNAFLLGDAAHIHSPIGGQGMNSGIGDAISLGWKLALVISDDVPQTLLDTFAEERDAVGRALLAATDYGNRLAFNANTMVRALHQRRAAGGDTRATRARPAARERRAITHRLSAQQLVDQRDARAARSACRHARAGARPVGYRPQTIVMHPLDQQCAVTLVLRPDGYAGYVSDGAHAHGAVTYLRNVIGVRSEQRV